MYIKSAKPLSFYICFHIAVFLLLSPYSLMAQSPSYIPIMVGDITTIIPIYPDSDGDGYNDDVDAFPANVSEWLDTDGDGTGNNADDDDDGDGADDSWELTYGLDPLLHEGSLDSDGDGSSNLEEYANETIPNQFGSCSGSNCIVEIPTAPTVVTSASADILSDQVGAIAGSFSVSDSGNARYTIPLFTAPGTAGTAPKLALQYKSNGGNGTIGLGWSVGALSAISRCGSPITMTSADQFCLDGERLVLDNPADTYGADGVEYRTEIDSFKKVVSHGAIGDGPEWFEVWHKNGSVSQYGYTADSALIPAGQTTSTVTVWAQNRIEDAFSYTTSADNPVIYSYINNASTSDLRIDTIEYAFANTSSANALIEFNYESGPRPDPITGYVNGYYRELDTRLDNIVVKNKVSGTFQELRTYYLSYLDVSNWLNKASKLVAVSECRGAVCLPSTSFTWSDQAIDFDLTQSSSTAGFASQTGKVKTTDIDADGYTDLIWLEDAGSGDSYIHASRSNGSTLGSAVSSTGALSLDGWTVNDFNQDGYPDILYVENAALYLVENDGSGSSTSFSGTPVQLLSNLDQGTETGLDGNWFNPEGVFADLNSDGLVDIFYNKAVYYQEKDAQELDGPYQFSSTAEVITFGDPATGSTLNNTIKSALDGDYSASIPANYEYATVDINAPDFAGDFNGDGLSDMVVKAWYEDSTTTFDDLNLAKVILTNNGDGTWSYYDHFGLEVDTALDETGFRIADFNNDGLSDILWHDRESGTSDKWNSQINTGAGLNAPYAVSTFDDTDYPEGDVKLIDYNQDGKTDFIQLYSQTGDDDLEIAFGSGDGEFTGGSVTVTLSANASGKVVYTDISGDGILDIADLAGYTWLGEAASGIAYNRIYMIENGLGAETTVTYSTLTNTDVYFVEDNAAELDYGDGEPVFDLIAPIYVVSMVDTVAAVYNNNGAYNSAGSVDTNALISMEYAYQGLKVQPEGRGMLGFHKRFVKNSQTLVQTETTYRQDFPYIGLIEETVTLVPSGSTSIPVSKGEYTWSEYDNSSDTIYQPILTQQVNTTWLAQSSAVSPSVTVGGIVRTETLVHELQDGYGNVGKTTATVTGDGETYTTITERTFSNDASKWHIGRLLASEVTTSDTTGAPTIVRESANTYDSTTGNVLTETREPNKSVYTLTTTYLYDEFGNRERATESDGTTSRYTEVGYDATGRFIDDIYNSLGQRIVNVVERNEYGAAKEIEGLNGVASYTSYGTFGRPFFESNDSGSWGKSIYRFCTQVSCPTGAEYRLQSVAADGSEQFVYYDNLARPVRTQVRSFNGTLSTSDNQYDELGRLVRSSTPYFPGMSSPYWAETQFDVLGRAIKVINSDNSVATSSYGFASGEGHEVVTTNALGQTKTSISNNRGQIIKVTDDLGGRITYEYDTRGNLITLNSLGSVSESHNIVTEIDYDLLGRRVSLDDPDQGIWTYEYNKFGEMTKQTDALGQHNDMAYDLLGRILIRKDYNASSALVGDTGWTYATAGDGIGQVAEVIDNVSDFQRDYYYDSLGRIQNTITSLGQAGADGTYNEWVTYDQYGRLFQELDATNAGIQYEYNANGYMSKIKEAVDTNKVYYEVTSTDAWGGVTQEKLGTLYNVNRSYDAQTGLPSQILASIPTLLKDIQDVSLSFDDIGNLTARDRMTTDDAFNEHTIDESFHYDELNRLTQVDLVGQSSQYFDYDIIGNMTSKTGVGTMSYGQNGYGPHAVTTADTDSYTYDAVGNMLTGGGRTVAYNTFRKPVTIDKGNHTTTFTYGPDRKRYKRVDDDGVNTKTTVYVGNVEIMQTNASAITTKRYISDVAVVTDTPTSHEVHYTFRDHLGSIDLIANEDFTDVQELSFDAWGKRRNVATFADLMASEYDVLNDLTTRGYTGHEMIDEVGLIHMNGRVYDPTLGRFLSADPVISAVTNTQRLNRYSYVKNNPLSFTDPSGFDEIYGVIDAAQPGSGYSGGYFPYLGAPDPSAVNGRPYAQTIADMEAWANQVAEQAVKDMMELESEAEVADSNDSVPDSSEDAEVVEIVVTYDGNNTSSNTNNNTPLTFNNGNGPCYSICQNIERIWENTINSITSDTDAVVNKVVDIKESVKQNEVRPEPIGNHEVIEVNAVPNASPNLGVVPTPASHNIVSGSNSPSWQSGYQNGLYGIPRVDGISEESFAKAVAAIQARAIDRELKNYALTIGIAAGAALALSEAVIWTAANADAFAAREAIWQISNQIVKGASKIDDPDGSGLPTIYNPDDAVPMPTEIHQMK